MADVRFHPEVLTEYTAALAWYRAQSGLAADRFESEVERLVGSIAANPSLFPPYDDEHRFARLRRFPYCLVYQAVPDGVQVVALAHVRRRPGYWRGRG